MTTTDWHELAESAAMVLREMTGVDRHEAVIVLGSGWGPAASALGEVQVEFPVARIPGFLAPVAPGHAGIIRSTQLEGHGVLVVEGRTHLYEGHGPGPVAHPIRTAAAAGCTTAVLTNANGSLRTDWPIGTGMVMTDHLNFTGISPLEGARFVDLSNCWSHELRDAALAIDPSLRAGVYAMLSGPHYETAAEARMLRTLGADVVGMSAVMEVIAARERSMQVLGISVVSAIEHDGNPLDPDDVVTAAESATARLGRTIAAALSATLPKVNS